LRHRCPSRFTSRRRRRDAGVGKLRMNCTGWEHPCGGQPSLPLVLGVIAFADEQSLIRPERHIGAHRRLSAITIVRLWPDSRPERTGLMACGQTLRAKRSLRGEFSRRVRCVARALSRATIRGRDRQGSPRHGGYSPGFQVEHMRLRPGRALSAALVLLAVLLSTSGCAVLDWMGKHHPPNNPPPPPRPGGNRSSV
jgi:hypothetical protein